MPESSIAKNGLSSAEKKTRAGVGRALGARWRGGDPEQRRNLIVETALDLLEHHGLDAVTMRSVAGRLGVGTMTLYTYVNGQRELHREMVRQGFDQMRQACRAQSTLDTQRSWRGGAGAYLRFAVDHPNLYKLMFDHPISPDDDDLMRGGFQQLLERVRQQLAQNGVVGKELHHTARQCASRYWIAMHGLAMLAIAGRISVLEGDLDQVLDDLLPRIAPT